MRRRTTFTAFVTAGLLLTSTPAHAAPDFADVLAATIERDVPSAHRIDPWAVPLDEAEPRPIDGWARPDVISPARLAVLRLERIRAEERRAAREAEVSDGNSVPEVQTYSSGSVWDAVAECEGGGNWDLVTTGNGYYFVLQFAPGTWLSNGGTQAELDAGVAPSPSRLIEVAENVLQSQGSGGWPNCWP